MYYNPPPLDKYKPPLSLVGLNFDKNTFVDYVDSKRTDKLLNAAHELSKKTETISVLSLKSVLMAYKHVSDGFITVVSQALIAKMAHVSVTTVKKAVAALRKVKLITTYHRYTTKDGLKRRTTSKTVLTGFIAHCEWLKTSAMKNIRAKIFTAKKKEKTEVVIQLPTFLKSQGLGTGSAPPLRSV